MFNKLLKKPLFAEGVHTCSFVCAALKCIVNNFNSPLFAFAFWIIVEVQSHM